MLHYNYAYFSAFCTCKVSCKGLIISLKHLEKHCAGCACVCLHSSAFCCSLKMNVWISRAASKPQSQLVCDKVWHTCRSLILTFHFFPLPSLFLTLHLNPSLFHSFTNKLTGSPLIRIWLQCAWHVGKRFWHDMRSYLCLRVCSCVCVHMPVWIKANASGLSVNAFAV